MNFLFAQAPSFALSQLEVGEYTCGTFNYVQVRWQPNGQALLINILPFDLPGSRPEDLDYFVPDYSLLFLLTLPEGQLRQLTDYLWLTHLSGWMNNNRFVYSDYFAGGNHDLFIQDLPSGEILAKSALHGHLVEHVNADYAFATSGELYLGTTAIALGLTAVRPPSIATPEDKLGTNLRSLSTENHREWSSFTQMLDWISEANQLLVLYWLPETPLPRDLFHEAAVTSLRMWSVDTNELTLLVPEAVYGSISPLRHYLAYLKPSPAAPELHLVDRVSGESLFLAPLHTEQNYTVLKVYTSFAPDDSYLTYFDANGNLVVYDLAEQAIHVTLPATFALPLWSPDSRFMVYEDPAAGLTVLEPATGRILPLAAGGAARLSDPQWSHDGAYLSVYIAMPGHTHHTAILRMPSP